MLIGLWILQGLMERLVKFMCLRLEWFLLVWKFWCQFTLCAVDSFGDLLDGCCRVQLLLIMRSPVLVLLLKKLQVQIVLNFCWAYDMGCVVETLCLLTDSYFLLCLFKDIWKNDDHDVENLDCVWTERLLILCICATYSISYANHFRLMLVNWIFR